MRRRNLDWRWDIMRISRISKINTGNRIFYNPNSEQKKCFYKIKEELEQKYAITLSNRDFIIKQLISTLTHGDYINHNMPNIDLVITRSDIKNFYPSINKHMLYKKLKQSNIISQYSFTNLQSMFFSKSVKGVPLGLPFSSVLAEIYLEQFDSDINHFFNPTFYFRYVDDIIIINYDTMIGIKNEDISSKLTTIFRQNNLLINTKKTKISNFNKRENFNFDFLGYNFKTINHKLLISISDDKFLKIVNNIKYYFYLFKKSSKNERQFWLLYYRLINTIYGVTSTNKNNKKIRFGLGYSYNLVNDSNQIDLLISIIKGLIHSCSLNSKRRSTLFYILSTKDTPLEILNKRLDYTKLTNTQLSKIKYRLGIRTSSNNISRIFFRLYKDINHKK